MRQVTLLILISIAFVSGCGGPSICECYNNYRSPAELNKKLDGKCKKLGEEWYKKYSGSDEAGKKQMDAEWTRAIKECKG